jgi:hypothetical protein
MAKGDMANTNAQPGHLNVDESKTSKDLNSAVT